MSIADARIVIDEQNPWPGLAAFSEAAERFFNGRDAERQELRRLVSQATLTVLFGKSGLGKSSLIQAGLFPTLERDHLLPVYIRFNVREREVALIDQARHAFLEALDARGVEASPIGESETLWEYLHRANLELWSRQNRLLVPLFVFDQFEEVFTLGAENPAAIAELRRDLADLIENRIPSQLAARIEGSVEASQHMELHAQPYKVLVSLREDFLPAAEGWKRELPSIMRNRLRLLPMSADQALAAVHDTAPHLVDRALAREIVEFVSAAQQVGCMVLAGLTDEPDDREVEPALLSLVCHGLNEKRKAQNKRKFDEALLQGTGQAIIADYYNEAVESLPDSVHIYIESELITERGFRRPSNVDDAIGVHHVTYAQLRLLVDRRLLRIEPRQGSEWVELTHDLLSTVVREHRDSRRMRERQQDEERRERDAKRARRRYWLLIILVAVCALAATVAAGVLALYVKEKDQERKATDQALIASERAVVANKLQLEANAAKEQMAHYASAAEANAADADEQRKIAKREKWIADDQRARAERNEHVAEELRKRAQQGEFSTTLGQLAMTGAGGSPPRSALLAVESVGEARRAGAFRTSSAESLLRNVLLNLEGVPLAGSVTGASALEYSPDGSRIAIAKDNTVLLVDAKNASPKPITLPCAAEVTAMKWSTNGQWIATGTKTGEVRIWRASDSFAQPLVLADLKGAVGGISADPAGKWLAVSGPDPLLRLWPASDLQERAEPLTLNTAPLATNILAFSADGNWIAAASHESSSILVGDLRNAADVRSVAMLAPAEIPERHIDALAFNADGTRLIAGVAYSVQMWTLAEGHPAGPAKIIGRTKQWTVTVAQSPDGRWAAAGSIDSILYLWRFDAQAGADAPAQFMRREHGSTVRSVKFAPKGALLASASADSTVRLWNLDDVAQAPTVLRGHQSPVDAIDFSPDGTQLVSLSKIDGERTWALPAGNLDPVTLDGGPNTNGTAFSADGHWIAAVGSDNKLRLWNMHDTRAPAQVLDGYAEATSYGAVDFSPDDHWLAAVAADTRRLRLRSLGESQDDARIQFTSPHDGPIVDFRFSPDGKWLATGGWDGQVMLWDMTGSDPFGAPRYRLSMPQRQPVRTLAFSKSGNRLIAGGQNGMALVWDLRSGVLSPKVWTLSHISTVRAVALSPDGRWGATGTWEPDFSVRVWDLGTTTANPPIRTTMKFQGRVFDLAFSPNGKWLAVADWDDKVGLINIRTEKSVALMGHSGRVFEVRFSPDSDWLASAGEDHTVRLWKLSDIAHSPLILPHNASVGSISFSPDGRWLMSGGEETPVRLWHMQVDELISLACKAAGRNLTADEWRTYLPGHSYHATCSF
jgi:WD40 repeat protein